MAFERYISNHDSEKIGLREPEGFPDLQKALARAEKQVFRYAIDPKEFAKPHGPYEPASIEHDLEYAGKLERKFKEDNLANATPGARARWETLMNAGKAFEAIILYNGENDWFGKNAQVMVPSRYDDIVHGIDGIVEFKDEKNFFSYLALGIDMTVSMDVERKFRKILDGIEKGELSMIRYFQSERQHIKGEKRNVPRVVIGADRETIRDLLVPWVDGKNKAFTEHYMQIQMLDEILWQLDAFARYAEEHGKGSLADLYRSDLAIMQKVLEERVLVLGEGQVKKMRLLASQDMVYQKIKDITNRNFKA